MSEKKINTATELWLIAHNWLLLSGSTPNAKFTRQEITTHPDYPAITSITDFLDSGGMAYNAVQADASYINEFNYPLLAHIRKPGEEYLHIIQNANQWDEQKEISIHWSGIVVYPEKNTRWDNAENNIYQNNTFKNKLFATALIIIGLGLFIIAAFYILNWVTIILGLLSFIGLTISVFLLGTELGYQSQLVKQVCGTISKGGCEKVLSSNYAKGLLGITPADASLLYFTTQFIVYLVASVYPVVLPTLFLVAFCGVPVAAWSIYTQAVKVKQWCALCLGVAGVLILEAIVAGILLNSQHEIPQGVIAILMFIIILLLLTGALIPIKQLIKTNNTNRQQISELKKWKSDAALFITQWKNEPACNTTVWQNDLVLGNLAAPILITVACNPYCGPCAKAHVQLDNLLHRFADKIRVQIRLLCNVKAETDIRTIAVKAILQKAASVQNDNELQQMLTDWFAWMNFKKWNTKWETTNDINVKEMMQKHFDWINKNEIAFTPTFFINGRKLPGRYNLKDIEILLPQLVEILIEDTVK